MNEKISRLMDGELDDAADFEQCVGSLRSEDAYATWVCGTLGAGSDSMSTGAMILRSGKL